ncbi:hypothetical protein M1D88_09370 [Arthrobacter sp. R1-13]
MNQCPRTLTAVLAACLGLFLLAGCSAGPDLDGGVAANLQTRVAAAKQSAAEQDYPAALAQLEQLGQEVTAAAGQGKMSGQRKARIEAAISTIRTDLEAAMTPAPAPTTPAPTVSAPESSLTEEQQEALEDAQKEADKQREEAQKEAEKRRQKAEELAEEQRNNG